VPGAIHVAQGATGHVEDVWGKLIDALARRGVELVREKASGAPVFAGRKGKGMEPNISRSREPGRAITLANTR
jgi:hypothetical protein